MRTLPGVEGPGVQVAWSMRVVAGWIQAENPKPVCEHGGLCFARHAPASELRW